MGGAVGITCWATAGDSMESSPPSKDKYDRIKILSAINYGEEIILRKSLLFSRFKSQPSAFQRACGH
jgi:hypothetical protein